jgi:feruloyl esterase
LHHDAPLGSVLCDVVGRSDAIGWRVRQRHLDPPLIELGSVKGQGYINYMVAQSPSVDWLQLDPTAYTSRIDQLVTIIDPVDPDLGRFKAHGGKLILWTGLADWLITANNATDYYKKVVQKSGGQAAADEFVEYYTAPGVQHCSGGTGADQVDLVGPMFQWLEKGIKPSTTKIVAKQSTPASGATAFTRPLCQYPAYPKYNGTGDPNVEASFTCTVP